ncbi:ABC transporter ATP-binding protein [Acuticoccus mangrovi]|uniref:Spermidine/putrescine import ATP-binding protein PotA n=1 Tax=Acuticoccus mangrovi TaxID=2796142 RepID=A0A934IJI2_9HYPH|nr:ABC transporter ATP-binding protein [Acuticoccus mangrovi]MBJ3777844.1 ABC transporter ATP-binding protein [Acuticoccus mangrovi]
MSEAATLTTPVVVPAPPLIRFEGVTKRFGSVVAVDDLTLDIHAGEFFALLGPSGCGKTTLMRLLAGFETPTEGRILLDGAVINDVPAHRRPTNMMFQSYALFPHLSVWDNIAFGLRREGLGAAEIKRRVAEMLDLVQLTAQARRKPHQLSGGQRQRVALARALAKSPRILLLDEPLAALDKKLRGETQFELTSIQRRLGITFCVVTHDQDEAMVLADRIAVMRDGRIEQVAGPTEIYETPASRAVAGFIGEINLFDGSVTRLVDGFAEVAADGMVTPLRVPAEGCAPVGTRGAVAVRPEKVAMRRTNGHAPTADNVATGTVTDAAYMGEDTLYRVATDGGPMVKVKLANSRRQAALPIDIGERVVLTFHAADALFLDR